MLYLYSVVLSFISLLKGPEYILKYYSYSYYRLLISLQFMVLTINEALQIYFH